MPKIMNDILRDQEGDLFIKNGDLVIGDGTRSHQEDILMSEKGGYRESPTVGAGVWDSLLDDDADLLDLQQEIQSQFEQDGMTVYEMDIRSLPTMKIKAAYE